VNWLKRLFKHRHKWETTHTNKWQHPTAQICTKCTETRNFVVSSFGEGYWLYANGDKSQAVDWGEQ